MAGFALPFDPDTPYRHLSQLWYISTNNTSGAHLVKSPYRFRSPAWREPGQKTQAAISAQSAPVPFNLPALCTLHSAEDITGYRRGGLAGVRGVAWRGVAGSEPLNPFGPSGDTAENSLPAPKSSQISFFQGQNVNFRPIFSKKKSPKKRPLGTHSRGLPHAF